MGHKRKTEGFEEEPVVRQVQNKKGLKALGD